MRKICRILTVLITWIILGVGPVSAQEAKIYLGDHGVGINADGSQPDTSAILDVKSTSMGMLLPRMSLAQRDAIIQPATGLLVFVTDSSTFYFNAGNATTPDWQRLGGGGDGSYWKTYAGTVGVIQPTAGQVLIGDSSAIPGGYKLYVNGGILTNRLTVAFPNSSQWADYVFAPGFDLRPLPEVEKYIRAHRHLPDVPSAQQVTEEGVEVVKMQALLLQKIEEMTLYQIEFEKQLQRLKKKIQTLEAENRKLTGAR